MKPPWYLRAEGRSTTLRIHPLWALWRLAARAVDSAGREFRWYRRRTGGEWVRLWAHLLPAGGCEFWHHVGVDPDHGMETKVLAREVYS